MALRQLLTVTLCASMLASPATAGAQRTAPTVCKDGSMLPQGNRRFCAPHRGVDSRATAAIRRRLSERSRARARAHGPLGFTCRDGSRTTTSGWSACGRHGGLAGDPGAATPAPRDAASAAIPAKKPPTAAHAAPPGRSP